MADAFVQVQPDQAGKKVQTFEITVSGQVVEAQATVTVDPATGAPVSLATQATLAALAAKDFATQTTLALTAANQALEIAALNRIEYKLPPLVLAKDLADPRGLAVPVAVASAPLPAHAATDTLQAAGNASLAGIAANTPALVNGREPVDGSGVTQPISVAVLPLPSGASIESTQAQIRRIQELSILQAMDAEVAGLASRGRERFALSINRGGR